MTAAWVEEEMVGLDLSDARLNVRFQELLSDFSSRPNANIPVASAPRCIRRRTGGLSPPRSPVSVVAARGIHCRGEGSRNDVID